MIYYVYQGRTYGQQYRQGCVWSERNPQINVPGFERMRRLEPGDIILHACDTQILAISVVRTFCHFTENTPYNENPRFCESSLNAKGYHVGTRYYSLWPAVDMHEHKEWLVSHYVQGSAFDVNGQGLRSYLCELAPSHAVHLLQACINKNRKTNTTRILNLALDEAYASRKKQNLMPILGERNSVLGKENNISDPKKNDEICSEKSVPQLSPDELYLAARALLEQYQRTHVELRFRDAMELYKKAARAGHSRSQYIVGMCYLDGRNGFPKDAGQAVGWLKRAANAGEQDALTELYKLFPRGHRKGKRRRWKQFLKSPQSPGHGKESTGSSA